MQDFAYLMAKGGPLMYAVLAGAVLTLGFNTILAAVLAFRRRVPAVLFLAMPLATVTFGLLGWAMGLKRLQDAVPMASLQMRDTLTFSGLSIAPLPQWLALTCCSVLLAMTAALLGLTVAIGAGKGARWCFAGPVVTFGLGTVGVVGTTAWALFERSGTATLLLIPGVLMFGGFGVVLAALRLAKEDKDAQRCAAGRAFVGACAVLSVAIALVVARMNGLMIAQEGLATASPEAVQSIMALGLFSARTGTWIGLAALAVVFVAHLIPVLGARRYLFKTYALVSGSLTGLALLFGVGGHLAVNAWAGHIASDTMMFRAVAISEEVPGLPAAAETYTETRISHFETVITYSGGRWTRADQRPDLVDSWDPTFVALVATPATTPAQSLLETESLAAGGPQLAPRVQIMVQRPAFMETPDSPYFHWGRLGAVTFLHLPLSRLHGGLDLITGATGAESIPVGPTWPPAGESIYVFDGSAAGNAEAWGVASKSRETWVSLRGEPARSIGRGEEAAHMLRSLTGESRPAHILFVPGEQWTVEDLVRLWMFATDEASSSWEGWSLECALDDHAPAPG